MSSLRLELVLETVFEAAAQLTRAAGKSGVCDWTTVGWGEGLIAVGCNPTLQEFFRWTCQGKMSLVPFINTVSPLQLSPMGISWLHNNQSPLVLLSRISLWCCVFYPCVGTIYEGTTNVQLSTMAKFIDKEYDHWSEPFRLDLDRMQPVCYTPYAFPGKTLAIAEDFL